MLTQNFERIIRRKKEKDEEGILAVGEKEAQDKQKEELLLKKREETIKEIQEKVESLIDERETIKAQEALNAYSAEYHGDDEILAFIQKMRTEVNSAMVSAREDAKSGEKVNIDEIDSAEKIFQIKMKEKSKMKMAQASASPQPPIPPERNKEKNEQKKLIALLDEAEENWVTGQTAGSVYRDFLFEKGVKLKFSQEDNNGAVDLINRRLETFYADNAMAIGAIDGSLAASLQENDFRGAKNLLEAFKIKYDINAEACSYIEQAEGALLETQSDIENQEKGEVNIENSEDTADLGEKMSKEESPIETAAQDAEVVEDKENLLAEKEQLKKEIEQINKHGQKSSIMNEFGTKEDKVKGKNRSQRGKTYQYAEDLVKEKEDRIAKIEKVIADKEKTDAMYNEKIRNLKQEIEELNSDVRKNLAMDKHGKDFAFDRGKTYQHIENSIKEKEAEIRRLEQGLGAGAVDKPTVNPDASGGDGGDKDYPLARKDYPLARVEGKIYPGEDEKNPIVPTGEKGKMVLYDNEADPVYDYLKGEVKLLEYHKGLEDLIKLIQANEDELKTVIIRKEFCEKIDGDKLRNEKMAVIEQDRQAIMKKDKDLKDEAEICFIKELKDGRDIDEMRNSLLDSGEKDLVRILETVENRIKFMSPDRVKENFGRELEYLTVNSEEKIFFRQNKDNREYKDLLKMAEILGFADEVEREKSKFDNLCRKGSEKSRPMQELLEKKLRELKQRATEWAKLDIYFEKQQVEMATKKSSQAKGEDSIWDKIKDNIKTFGKFAGGLAKFMVTFKAAGAAVGTVATGGTAAAGAFLATAGAMTIGKEINEGRLNRKYRAEAAKEEIDFANEDHKNKLKANTAALIGIDQMEKINPEKRSDSCEYNKKVRDYASGKINKEEKTHWLENRMVDQYSKNKIEDAELKETDLNEHMKAILALKMHDSETEFDSAKMIFERMQNKKDQKAVDGFLRVTLAEKVGKMGKKFGKDMLHETAALGLYEVPIVRQILMGGGGAQLGKEIFGRWFKEDTKRRKIAEYAGMAIGAVGLSYFLGGGKKYKEEVAKDCEMLGSMAKLLSKGEGGQALNLAWGRFKAHHGFEEEAGIGEDATKGKSAEKNVETVEKDVEPVRKVGEKVEKVETGAVEPQEARQERLAVKDAPVASEGAVESAPKKMETIKSETVLPAAGKTKAVDLEIKVKEGDKLWEISKEIQQQLSDEGFNLEVANKKIPEDTATGAANKITVDAIKDFLVKKHVTEYGGDGNLIKQGQELKVNMGELMKYFEGEKGIIKQVENLTPKQASEVVSGKYDVKMAEMGKIRERGKRSAEGVMGEMVTRGKSTGGKTSLLRQAQDGHLARGGEAVEGEMVEMGDGVGLSDAQRNGAINEIFQLKLQNSERYKQENQLNSNQYAALIEKIKANDSNKNDFSLEDKIAFLKNENKWIREVKEATESRREKTKIEDSYKKEMEILDKMKGKHIEESVVEDRNTLKAVERGEFEFADKSIKVKGIEVVYAEDGTISKMGGYDVDIVNDFIDCKSVKYGKELAKEINKAQTEGRAPKTIDESKIEVTLKEVFDYVREKNNFVKEIGEKNVKYITEKGKLIPERVEVVKSLADEGYKVGAEISERDMGNCLRLLPRQKALNLKEKIIWAKFNLDPENSVNAREFLKISGFPAAPGEKLTPRLNDAGEVNLKLLVKEKNIERHFNAGYDTKKGKFFWKNVFGFREYYNSPKELRDYFIKLHIKQRGNFLK